VPLLLAMSVDIYYMRNPVLILKDLLNECLGAVRLAEGGRSIFRLCADYFWLRYFRFSGCSPSNRVRKVRFKGGTVIQYRLNEGDLQGIREVWMDECYRLPSRVKPDTLVDLGGNIGLTSVWLALRHGVKHHIVVEADAANAALLRANLAANGLKATVIEAAVGPHDGEAHFASNNRSNIGQVVGSEAGGNVVTIPMVSMSTVLRGLASNHAVDLLKLDIEGGEEVLMQGPLGWLSRVRFIVAELHPPDVDCAFVVGAIESTGLVHHPSDSLFPGSMTCFERAGS